MRFISILFALLFGVLVAQPGQAAVDVSVDLTSQTLTARSSSGEVRNWAISSGRAGYATPRGTYRAQRLARMHYSRKYDNAPMPHSIFFRGGFAIHGTSHVSALGRPASHGCVRLSPGAAAQLYEMVRREGARIVITGSPPGAMIASKAKASRVARAGKSTYAKSRYAKSRFAKARFAKAHDSGRRFAQRGSMQARDAAALRGGLRAGYGDASALGYAPRQAQPTVFQWLRAPSW
jgi:hypothetical protein